MPAINVRHALRLDLDKGGRGSCQSVTIRQGDIGSQVLDVALEMGGAAWAVPEGLEVRFEAVKPDGTVVHAAGEPCDGRRSRVLVPLPDQCGAVPGDFRGAYVTVYDGTALVATTESFGVSVLPGTADHPMSDDYYSEFDTLYDRHEALMAQVRADADATFERVTSDADARIAAAVELADSRVTAAVGRAGEAEEAALSAASGAVTAASAARSSADEATAAGARAVAVANSLASSLPASPDSVAALRSEVAAVLSLVAALHDRYVTVGELAYAPYGRITVSGGNATVSQASVAGAVLTLA